MPEIPSNNPFGLAPLPLREQVVANFFVTRVVLKNTHLNLLVHAGSDGETCIHGRKLRGENGA